jgi:hypothetical protein
MFCIHMEHAYIHCIIRLVRVVVQVGVHVEFLFHFVVGNTVSFPHANENVAFFLFLKYGSKIIVEKRQTHFFFDYETYTNNVSVVSPGCVL